MVERINCNQCGNLFYDNHPYRKGPRYCSKSCFHNSMKMTIEEVFLKHYNISIRTEKGCLEWVGSFHRFGYGRVCGRHAHKFAYEYFNKTTVPEGLVVRHKCHNPKCIEIKHLELGTQQDNIDDKVKAGRQIRGSNIATAKLTEADVVFMRENADKYSSKELSDMFNISRKYVGEVLNGKMWSHVDAKSTRTIKPLINTLPEFSKEQLDYFWSLVIKDYNELGCWKFKNLDRFGYGTIKFRHNKVVYRLRSHKLSYILANGSIPEGLIVRHEVCGNRFCCNPKHLAAGTYKDNAEDEIKHQKTLRGSKNGKSKFTEDQVKEIRSKHTSGSTIIGLSKEYGVDKSTIRRIINYESYNYNYSSLITPNCQINEQ